MGRLRDYAHSFDPPPGEGAGDPETDKQPSGIGRLFHRKKARAPRAKGVVWLLVVALAVYFIIIGQRGVTLLRDPHIALKVLGVAVLVLPFIGAWVVIAELRFGVATQILAERMDAEGAEAEPELPTSAGGRYDRAAADALFQERKAVVEDAPDDWHGWYLLSLAYDYSGDRKRAREAMRAAIEHADLKTPPAQP